MDTAPHRPIVMTLIGKDRPGLVEKVAELVAEHGGNWLESRMARLGGQFAGILRVQVPESGKAGLVGTLQNLSHYGLAVTLQDDPETALPTPTPAGSQARLEIVGQDRPGIVRQITRILASRGVNVEELVTDVASAPMSGESLFTATIHLQIPPGCDLEQMRGDLETIAADLMVECALEPLAQQSPDTVSTPSASKWLSAALLCCILVSIPVRADPLPSKDQRAGSIETLDTLRAFPDVTSRAAWDQRARRIREQVLISCGLWPEPARTPLEARIAGRIDRDGYSVEKVYFQSYPGFYVAGNLYRPQGRGEGPFPALLNPHGHWGEGRLVDSELGSIAARCINFARQGMIAFSYDMVGYNDTAQVNHKFALQPANQLWNISLMGLQTWNSIRALDFLTSIPGVDTNRLGCTGESGGGTQTFILSAIEPRVASMAPMVMVSHSMQGGCLCENAPGLRILYSNMEIAAAAAPRPQLLVAATGDWTKATLDVEGPAIAKVYKLFGAPDHLRYVRFDFPHNYNKTTREEAYRWFNRWLNHYPNPDSLQEQSYQKEPNQDLLVFSGNQRPSDARTEDQLIQDLIAQAKMNLAAIQPKDADSLARFQAVARPAWEHTLQIEFPDRNLIIESSPVQSTPAHNITSLHVGRAGQGDRIPMTLVAPKQDKLKILIVLAHPEGRAAHLDPANTPLGLAKAFLDQGCSVLLFDAFLTGALTDSAALKARNHFDRYFTTYNRTDLQERVQDVVTACTVAHHHGKGRKVVLCGSGRAGLWALLAAQAADSVAVDCDALDLSDPASLLAQEWFTPGFLRYGGFDVAAALLAPRPAFLHHTGAPFPTSFTRAAYDAARSARALRLQPDRATEADIVAWALK